MHRVLTLFKSKPFILLAGFISIACIAWADRRLHNAIPLGLLYLAPVVAISTVLRRWQIPLLGALCAVIAESSDAFPWTIGEGIPRDALYFFAYMGAGLYVSEALHRRRAEHAHMAAIEAEMEARRSVEEQLRLVVQNSSISIITADETGLILHANAAAERLFQGEMEAGNEQLRGMSLASFMPSLARVQVSKHGWKQLRTMMQCQGFRAGKDPFLADVWFSTYTTSRGGRLTAMIVDSSTEMRDREQANLEQVLVGSKIAIGALSHEIRNICAAISVVQQNLMLNAQAEDQLKEFDALRQLVAALERLASVELSLVKRQASKVQLDAFLRDLYIVIHSSLREAEIKLHWEIEPGLPDVWADQQSLLQVFLNLIRNAETVLNGSPGGEVRVCAVQKTNGVQITVSDNGPGVSSVEQLFRPFAGQLGASGLGLYLSRAMMRSFRGELSYRPGDRGATFAVELAVAGTEE
jgi:two-component system, LuxR family, sensor kinase FixL